MPAVLRPPRLTNHPAFPTAARTGHRAFKSVAGTSGDLFHGYRFLLVVTSPLVTTAFPFVDPTATRRFVANRFTPDIRGQHTPLPRLPAPGFAPRFIEDIAAIPTRTAPARTICVRRFMPLPFVATSFPQPQGPRPTPSTWPECHPCQKSPRAGIIPCHSHRRRSAWESSRFRRPSPSPGPSTRR